MRISHCILNPIEGDLYTNIYVNFIIEINMRWDGYISHFLIKQSTLDILPILNPQINDLEIDHQKYLLQM